MSVSEAETKELIRLEIPALPAFVGVARVVVASVATTVDGIEPDAVIAATLRDKKRTTGGVPFVLVRAPGDVRHGEAVDDAGVRAAVTELLR